MNLSEPTEGASTADRTEAAHRIHTLLHTIRCIAQYEDQLCTLLHASRKSARLTSGVRRELHALLEKLPSHEYTHDVEAVRELLDADAARGAASAR